MLSLAPISGKISYRGYENTTHNLLFKFIKKNMLKQEKISANKIVLDFFLQNSRLIRDFMFAFFSKLFIDNTDGSFGKVRHKSRIESWLKCM